MILTFGSCMLNQTSHSWELRAHWARWQSLNNFGLSINWIKYGGVSSVCALHSHLSLLEHGALASQFFHVGPPRTPQLGCLTSLSFLSTCCWPAARNRNSRHACPFLGLKFQVGCRIVSLNYCWIMVWVNFPFFNNIKLHKNNRLMYELNNGYGYVQIHMADIKLLVVVGSLTPSVCIYSNNTGWSFGFLVYIEWTDLWLLESILGQDPSFLQQSKK